MYRNGLTVLIVGIIVLILGLIIRYIIRRRRFYRRTYGGMQKFENYNKAQAIPLIEKIFMFLSTIMVFVGLFFIGVWYFNRN